MLRTIVLIFMTIGLTYLLGGWAADLVGPYVSGVGVVLAWFIGGVFAFLISFIAVGIVFYGDDREGF